VKAQTNRLTDAELDEAFSYACGSLRLTAALVELKERRAAAPTQDELDVLRVVRDDVQEFGLADDNARRLWAKAVAVLDRIIAGWIAP
jgi:hypothetical protein